jgi:hypothetical protein
VCRVLCVAGKYISLGYHEQDDVATVLAYLKSTDTVSNICTFLPRAV